MSSPLGLTTLNSLQYQSDTGNPIDPNYSGGYNSLFNQTKFYYRPSISTETNSTSVGNGNNKTVKKNVTSARSTRRHSDNSSDDIYDISTSSIIDYTNNEDLPAIKLKNADFAYLRDLGVYPNNRLLVGRRFPSPVENDLTAVSMSPLSTVITWIPDSADSFFSFDVSEDWQGKETSNDPLGELTDLFNKIFAKFVGTKAGDEGSGVLGTMFKKFPIGGVAEALETSVTNYLLGSDTENGTNFSYDNIVKGNPNFMSESSYRETNSIRSTISIPVKMTYEIKYFPNVDPTIAFMDILQNLLRFTGSESVFYISQAGGSKINQFFNKYKQGKWVDAVGIILDGIIHAVGKIQDDIVKVIGNIASSAKAILEPKSEQQRQEESNALRTEIESGLQVIASSSLARYRIEFSKIIPASTGASSAPWHITLGNPKNPFFSSADMIAKSGKITMGNTMGFNDLPTRIEFECKLESARNLGIQEIFDKFNVGAGRQYQNTAVKFVPDFYQGSVKNTPNNGNNANAATGG